MPRDVPPGPREMCSIRKVSLFFHDGKTIDGIFIHLGSNKSPIEALGPEKQEYNFSRYDMTEVVFGK